jgi:hypothetical protein
MSDSIERQFDEADAAVTQAVRDYRGSWLTHASK